MKVLNLFIVFLFTQFGYAGSYAPWNSNYKAREFQFENKRALIITTSYATLDLIDPKTGEVLNIGKPTGVYPSELTGPYYEFTDANIDVDIASIKGGEIPFEPYILENRILRSDSDSRYLKDPILQSKVKSSIQLSDVLVDEYDVIFLAGGWGASYDFAQSAHLAELISEAYAKDKIIGAICHGPLGLLNAKKPDGTSLVKGLNLTAVTDRQIEQLKIQMTPMHPERELRKAGALYHSEKGVIRDFFANKVIIDGQIVTGQNQKSDIEVSEKIMELLEKQSR